MNWSRRFPLDKAIGFELEFGVEPEVEPEVGNSLVIELEAFHLLEMSNLTGTNRN